MGRGMGDMACRHKTVMVFGILQLVMGISMLALGAVAISSKSVTSGVAHGVWGGVWVGLTGVLGLVGGIMKKRGLEIAFMVLSILSACVIWFILLLFSLGGTVGDAFLTHNDVYAKMSVEEKAKCSAEAADKSSGSVTYKTDYVLCTNHAGVQANFGILILSGLLLLMGIVSSALACCAVCKCCGAEREDAVSPQYA